MSDTATTETDWANVDPMSAEFDALLEPAAADDAGTDEAEALLEEAEETADEGAVEEVEDEAGDPETEVEAEATEDEAEEEEHEEAEGFEPLEYHFRRETFTLNPDDLTDESKRKELKDRLQQAHLAESMRVTRDEWKDKAETSDKMNGQMLAALEKVGLIATLNGQAQFTPRWFDLMNEKGGQGGNGIAKMDARLAELDQKVEDGDVTGPELREYTDLKIKRERYELEAKRSQADQQAQQRAALQTQEQTLARHAKGLAEKFVGPDGAPDKSILRAHFQAAILSARASGDWGAATTYLADQATNHFARYQSATAKKTPVRRRKKAPPRLKSASRSTKKGKGGKAKGSGIDWSKVSLDDPNWDSIVQQANKAAGIK